MRKAIERRVPVTEKLDALATILPDGIWLRQLSYHGPRLGDDANSPQLSLSMEGACWLPGSDREVEVISDFIDRMKRHQGLLRGMTTARLEEIHLAEQPGQDGAYRRFRAACETSETL